MGIVKNYKWFRYAVIVLFILSFTTVALYRNKSAYADEKVFKDLIMQAEMWSVCMMDPPDLYKGKDNIPYSVVQDVYNSNAIKINKV